jgi:hypothetical protein
MMNKKLPSPSDVLEELADKVIVGIDNLAVTTFRSALDEMLRYHRFLLDAYTTKDPRGFPFSYAEITGDRLGAAPHHDWVREYRRIFEHAAGRIAQETDFVTALANVPARLMPRQATSFSPTIISAILDLGPILLGRLEDWLTRRLTVESSPGQSASPRLVLAGSDKTAFSEVLMNFIGAWENLLQLVPTYYDWRQNLEVSTGVQWSTASASWAFLWYHLRNTAYYVASAVWNEDEIGAERFEDTLVRWSRALEFKLSDRYYSKNEFLLYPDMLNLGWDKAKTRLLEIDSDQFLVPHVNPFALFATILRRVHSDVILLASAVILRWYIDAKQSSTVALRTSTDLLRRKVIDPEIGSSHENAVGFRSLFFSILRIDLGGERFASKGYGALLDDLSSFLDQMSERRVIPGRIYVPSTIHGREGLDAPLLAILLANLPKDDDDKVGERVSELTRTERAFPEGDRSLFNVGEFFERMLQLLKASDRIEQAVLQLVGDDSFDHETAVKRLTNIFQEASEIIKKHRAQRVREMPIDPVALERIRSAGEKALLESPAGIEIFHNFQIERSPQRSEVAIARVVTNGLPKGVFTNPQMQWGWVNLDKSIIDRMKETAAWFVWQNFWRRPREVVRVESGPAQNDFWILIANYARSIGPQATLLLDGHTRLLMEWAHLPEKRPEGLHIENKAAAAKPSGHYITTVEGVDILIGGIIGKAVLFSRATLRSVKYEPISADGHILNLIFEPEEDPWNVRLITQFAQSVYWDETPIVEIQFPKVGTDSQYTG